MPRVSFFYGIAIYMYYRDHAPPHFHAIYGDAEATIAIDSADRLEGHLPPKALALVREWALLRRGELADDWTRARSGETLQPIAPLE